MLLGSGQRAVAQDQTFQLSGVRFNESVYLSDDALQGAIGPYMNRPIVFENVERMMADVEALYAARGIVTASVVLQPQEVNDGGVLQLTLIEARTEAVVLDAATGYQQNLLGNVFPTTAGTFPDYAAMTRQLRFFQIAYGVLPSISFAPGQSPASTIQTVSLEAPQQSGWSVQLDNHANDGQDRNQLTIARSYRNFSGRLDQLSASARLTAGGFGLDGQYRIPVGPAGGTASLSAAYSQNEVVAGAFASSGLETQSVELAANYAQPFWVDEDSFYQFQIGLNASNTKSTISGVALQDNTLLDVDGRVIFVRSLENAAFSAEAGLRIGYATSASESETDGGFALAFGKAAYDRKLGERFRLGLTARAQLAPDANLPSGQRFSVGGLESLVGYPDDVRAGDSGLSGRAELVCTFPCFGEGFATYRPEIYGFADFGYVDVFRGDDASISEEPWLFSVGIGGSFVVRDAVVTTAVGVPLMETTGFDDVGEPRVYAAVTYAF